MPYERPMRSSAASRWRTPSGNGALTPATPEKVEQLPRGGLAEPDDAGSGDGRIKLDKVGHYRGEVLHLADGEVVILPVRRLTRQAGMRLRVQAFRNSGGTLIFPTSTAAPNRQKPILVGPNPNP